MASKPYIHKPNYGPFRGIDTSKTKITLGAEFCSDAENVQTLQSEPSISSRRGFKRGGRPNNITTSGAGFGLYQYTNTDAETGEITEELISLDLENDKVYRLDPLTFTLTKPDNGAIYVSFYLDTATQKHVFQITDPDDVVLYTKFTDSFAAFSSVTVQDLITDINAAAGLSLYLVVAALGTATGDEYVSDFLPYVVNQELSTSLTLTGEWWVEVNRPDATAELLQGVSLQTAKRESELPSAANAQNCLFIATGFDEILKYDGQNVYKAGLPPGSYSTPLTPDPAVAASATGLDDGWYAYAQAFEQVDAKGNVIEGLGWAYPVLTAAAPLTPPTSKPKQVEVVAGSKKVDVDYQNLPKASGFNTNCALVDGAQTITASDLTIAVDDGASGPHTLNVGDTACFRLTQKLASDSSVNDIYLVEAEVTAITANTITISPSFHITHGLWKVDPVLYNGGASTGRFAEEDVDVSDLIDGTTYTLNLEDGAPISNNLRVNIYRNTGYTDEQTEYSFLWYLHDIYPNNSFASSASTFTDQITTVGPVWEQKLDLSASLWPDTFNVPLPKAKYVTELKGRLYFGGMPTAPNVIDRSDILYGYEFVNPTASAQLDVSTSKGDKVSGLRGVEDVMFVGKTGSIGTITGDLASDTNVRVETKSKELACVSHAGMAEALNLAIIPTQFGPVLMDSSGNFKFLGPSDDGKKSRLHSIFTSPTSDLKRCVSVVNDTEGYYAIFVPTSDDTSLGFKSLSVGDSSNLTTDIGTLYVYEFANDAWWPWKRVHGSGGMQMKDGVLYWARAGYTGTGYTGGLFTQHSTLTDYDYIDWLYDQTWSISTRHEHLDEPLQSKLFNKLRLYGDCVDAISGTTEIDWREGTTNSGPFEVTPNVQGAEVKLSTAKARAMRLVLTSTGAYTKPILSGIELEVAAPFRPKIKAT